MATKLFDQWTASGNGLICSADPENGGIIDKALVSGEWFVIFNRDGLKMADGFDTCEDAKEYFIAALRAA